MATVETLFHRIGGYVPGRCKLYCTVTLAAGAATVKPGSNATNVSSSGSLLKILEWGVSNQTAARFPQIVKSFDATQGGDILTFTGTGTDVYDCWLEGIDSGADVA